MIGAILTLIPLAIVVWELFNRWRSNTLSLLMISLWSGICGWLAIGWFEGYMWGLFTHQVLLWSVLAVLMLPPEPDSSKKLQHSELGQSSK